MRTLYVFNLLTLDGYFEGPNHDISWHNVDDEFRGFAVEQLNETGTLLFGRVTYELMAAFWPSPDAVKNDPIVAGQMNSSDKFVFSGTMAKAEWSNTRLVRENAAGDISALKAQQGKDIGILGSSRLAVGLMSHGLIDEFRFMIAPAALGQGTPVFSGLEQKVGLRLIDSRVFRSGNVLLRYGNIR